MTPQAPQSGVAQVNDTQLYYEVAGTGHPFTLIHGLLLDRRCWDDQFEVFAQQYHVLRYDLRGWGGSAQEQTEPPFSPRQDLLSLLHSLAIEKTYLLGLSGGGTFALDFTLEHAEQVDALILVSADPSGYLPPMTDALQTLVKQYAWALQQGDSAGAAEATTRFWTDGPRRTPGQVNAQARARIRDMTTQQLQWHGDFMAHEEHMMPLAPPAIKRLSEVRVPTLIVVGEEDVPAVIEAASILEQGIPGAKRWLFPGRLTTRRWRSRRSSTASCWIS